MKVLFAYDNFDHGTGGAEKAMRALAAGLAARGDTVEAVQHGDRETTGTRDGVRVHSAPFRWRGWIPDRDRDTVRANRAWEPIAAEAIRAAAPAVVVTQLRLAPGTVRAAQAAGVPAVTCLHAYAPFCALQFRHRDGLTSCDRRCFTCLPFGYKLKYRWVRAALDLHEASLRGSRRLVANSRYMQKVLQTFHGLASECLYPVADLGGMEARDGPHDAVLFVKPQYVKGLPVLLKVAARMPDTRFVVVGRARRHVRAAFARLGNVEHLGWTNDMPAVYARARALFAPSIWPEPFGRVFVEAGLSGVPSVASGGGGAPEAVGDGGLLVNDVSDTDAWVNALRQALAPERHAGLAAAAREHARRLAGEDIVGRFRDLLDAARGGPRASA
jgi:glycosyltransferase involved in cell wall biosynthesis